MCRDSYGKLMDIDKFERHLDTFFEKINERMIKYDILKSSEFSDISSLCKMTSDPHDDNSMTENEINIKSSNVCDFKKLEKNVFDTFKDKYGTDHIQVLPDIQEVLKSD